MHTAEGERGNGLIEFVGILAGIILPSVVMLVACADVLAAHQAASAAASGGARAYVRAESHAEGYALLDAAVRDALAARGLGPAQEVELECASHPCLSPGSEVSVTVRIGVDIAYLGRSITVASTAQMPVDELRAARY